MALCVEHRQPLPAKDDFVSGCLVAVAAGEDAMSDRLHCAKASCPDYVDCVREISDKQFVFRLRRDLTAKRWGDALIGCSSRANDILSTMSLEACRQAFQTAIPEVAKSDPGEAQRHCALAATLRAEVPQVDALCAGLR